MRKPVACSLLALGISVACLFGGVQAEGRTCSGMEWKDSTVVMVRIRWGETLWSIANRYGTTVPVLTRLNGIANPNRLTAGRLLRVPQSVGNRGACRNDPQPVVSRSRDTRALSSWARSMMADSGCEELAMPVIAATLSSPYGYRHGRMHWGIDLACPQGTAVCAVAAGRVVYAGWESGYGLVIVVNHGGFLSRYAHNSRLLVNVGQCVCPGQQIAAVGHTGHATGDHLHLELEINGRRINPSQFFDCY